MEKIKRRSAILREAGQHRPEDRQTQLRNEKAAILKDVNVPEGFDVTPVLALARRPTTRSIVAAAPNGDLYVSSDGNGSLGRDPHRGRVLRLRDTDGDGRADEVTEFVKDIDSPRGLVWDHDRLYLLHPPHISVFIDKDGDGVAEESKNLINGIAFGFKDRPADHTTNGLEHGHRRLDLHRRRRLRLHEGDRHRWTKTPAPGRRSDPISADGSGLELFSTGTRNILGTPISPLLDMFARDNTNDGGGWDVRFHHFTGLEDHGYPRLYKNFGDEHISPLADYGGGSGCGSVYIREPGFPAEWNNAPFTCDWGTGALWQHSVERKGATFEETTAAAEIHQHDPADRRRRRWDERRLPGQLERRDLQMGRTGAGYIVRVSPTRLPTRATPGLRETQRA